MRLTIDTRHLPPADLYRRNAKGIAELFVQRRYGARVAVDPGARDPAA